MVAFFVVIGACSDAEPVATDGPPSSVRTPITTAVSAPPAVSSGTRPPPPASTTAPVVVVTNSAPPAPSAPTTTGQAFPPLVPIDDLQLGIELVADGFDQPVLVTAPPGDFRLFIVDQPGRIWVIEGDEVDEFLDIRDVVRFIGEQGLLGLAFHPEYATNHFFYLNFIDDRGGTVVSEFQADPSDPNLARPGSRRDVMRVAQPAANHNGGMIAFGPDGLLWIGLGDGGGSNDRYRNGQRSDRRLGSMLRIEVGPDAPEPFGEPTDGPFVEEGGLAEVWSIGLRNPWRWTFDEDDLYIADVGQRTIEEINVVPSDEPGLNFGWPLLEGRDCFRSATCDRDGLQLPVVTYTHRRGCSVTGGFVYRGAEIPELTGHYFFGDFCGGWVDSIVVGDDRELIEQYEWFSAGTLPGLTSFGIDAWGEIYTMNTAGAVYRIVRS